jgi:cytochrome P450
MRTVDQFSMADPDVMRNPYAYYAAMRSEQPAHLDPAMGIWWVSRQETVARLALDAEAMSSKSPILLRRSFGPKAQALWDAAGMQVIDTFVTGDAPEHEHYRALGQTLFNPKKVVEMNTRIDAHVARLIDSFIGEREFDFVARYAGRLPAAIVCDEFGLPAADQPKFKDWTDSVIAAMTPGQPEDEEARHVAQIIELFSYLRRHLEISSADTSGRVIQALATATRKDGTPFSALERCWMLLFIFGGSNETTINMLASGVRRMARDPQLQARLRADPSLMPAFVEELLRMDGSVQCLLRVATRDQQVDGSLIPKGANVMLCIASANRDELRWENPDEFRLDRATGRRHLSFGQGPHTCIGNHLARRILESSFSQLLQRLSHFELAIADDQVPQVPLPFHRGIASLPIRIEAA